MCSKGSRWYSNGGWFDQKDYLDSNRPIELMENCVGTYWELLLLAKLLRVEVWMTWINLRCDCCSAREWEEETFRVICLQLASTILRLYCDRVESISSWPPDKTAAEQGQIATNLLELRSWTNRSKDDGISAKRGGQSRWWARHHSESHKYIKVA